MKSQEVVIQEALKRILKMQDPKGDGNSVNDLGGNIVRHEGQRIVACVMHFKKQADYEEFVRITSNFLKRLVEF